MAVTVDAHTSASGVALTTLGVTFSIAANSDRCVLGMLIGGSTSAASLNSATWAGTAMTEEFDVTTSIAGFFVEHAVASLVAPTTGSQTLTMNFNGTVSDCFIAGLSVFDVSQSDPVGTQQVVSGTSGAPSASVANTTGGMSVGMGYIGGVATITPRDGTPFYVTVGALSALGSTAAALTVTGQPGTRQVGDIELCSMANESNEVMTISGTGWATVAARITQGASWQSILIGRRYDGSNVDPIATWTTATASSGRRWLIRDTHPASPYGTAAANTGSAAAHTIAAGVNSSTTNSLIVYVDHAEANTALGADADYTERFDTGSATGPMRLVAGDRVQAVAGAGAAAFTATGALASWVLRLQEMLAATAQTQLREAQNVAGFSNMSVDVEDGAAYNQFGWTETSTSWVAVAFPINEAVAAAGGTTGLSPFQSPIFASRIFN